MKTIRQVCDSLQDQGGLPARIEIIAPWTDRCPFRAGTILELDPALGAWVSTTDNKDLMVLPFIIRRCMGVFFKAA